MNPATCARTLAASLHAPRSHQVNAYSLPAPHLCSTARVHQVPERVEAVSYAQLRNFSCIMLCATLQLCGTTASEAGAWRRVGTDFTNACTLDATQLLRSAQQRAGGPLFYDLYYVDGVDTDNAGANAEAAQGLAAELPGTPRLYPVPVAIVNDPEKPDDYVLARRFFALDAALGTAASSDAVEWLQYPMTAALAITVRCRVALNVLICTQLPMSTCALDLTTYRRCATLRPSESCFLTFATSVRRCEHCKRIKCHSKPSINCQA